MHTKKEAIRMVDLIEAINDFLPKHLGACVVTDDNGRVIPFPSGMCLHCAEGEFQRQHPHLFWRLFFDLLKSHGVDVDGVKKALQKNIEENKSKDPCNPYEGKKILRIIAEHLQ